MYSLFEIAINEMEVARMAEMNYQLSTEIKTNNVNLNFVSKGMNWTSLHVQFLLYSGQEIFSRVDAISIFGSI